MHLCGLQYNLNVTATRKDPDEFLGIPFYIFFSVLLTVLAVVGTRSVLVNTSLTLAVGYALLFAFHIALYWINLKYFTRPRWLVMYYLVHAALIATLVNYPSVNETVRLASLSTMVICLIGEALGLWGNTRRAFLLGLGFAGLAFILLYFRVDRDAFGISASSLLINGGFIILFMVVLNQQLSERKKAIELAESLESANAKLAAYNAKIESLTLQNERQRMARELHDTLAQGVAGLVLQLEAVKAHLSSDRKERASSIVEQALLRARATLSESRAAIDDLRSAPTNLSESIQEKVNRFTQATGIACDLKISVNENQVSNDVTNHAVSILNEALANITKHAQAKNVNVKFIIQNERLELEIHDDGKGFDASQESSGHYGLLGMRERARLSNGNLEIGSNQNGTRIHFVIGEK